MDRDKEINSIVLAKLESTPFLEGAKIHSETREGVVYLSGTVLDARQKEEAAKVTALCDEQICNVVNNVVVKEPVIESLMEIQVASSHNIKLIPAMKEALLKHPSLDVSGIAIAGVKGRKGIFRLTGTVPTEEDKKIAEESVNPIPGVSYVINEMEVGPLKEEGNIAPSMAVKQDPKACASLMEKYIISSKNGQIIGDIREALLGHPILDASNVSIRVADGCETGIYKLEGTVPDATHKKLAADVARAVKNVQYIENHLTIM
jgi:osmotically-inducible protein OsmY